MLQVASCAWLAGCAGGFGTYGPGMGGEVRTSKGVTPLYRGAHVGTYHERTYETSSLSAGVHLGARGGAVHANVGSIGSAVGFAVDAHADVVLAARRWGVGLTGGYTADRTTIDKNEYFFSAFPIGVYGQLGIVPELFLHAGFGRTIFGSVKRIDGPSADADAWRAFGGLTWVFARSDVRDFALRIEGRGSFSDGATLDARDATWTSVGVLGEIMWITF